MHIGSVTRRSTKVQVRGNVYGDYDCEAPTLSSAAPRRLRKHSPSTSAFALAEVRAAGEPAEPPPPLKRRSAPLVHKARAPDQRFRVGARCRKWGLSGLFLGTYSPLPYAAHCRRSPRTRCLRSGFAVESAIEVSLPKAAQGMPHAAGPRSPHRREPCRPPRSPTQRTEKERSQTLPCRALSHARTRPSTRYSRPGQGSARVPSEHGSWRSASSTMASGCRPALQHADHRPAHCRVPHCRRRPPACPCGSGRARLGVLHDAFQSERVQPLRRAGPSELLPACPGP